MKRRIREYQIEIIFVIVVAFAIISGMIGIGKAEPADVPIQTWGTFLKLASDDQGNVFMVLHRSGKIYAYDVINGKEYEVPDGTLYRDNIHSGISIGGGKVAVTWSPDNLSIKYCEMSLSSRTWGAVETAFTDDITGGDTNRNDVSLSMTGEACVVAQSDSCGKARIRHASGQWEAQQIFSPISPSEPTHPRVMAQGNDFYAICTLTICPQYSELGCKSAAVYRYHEGSWSNVHAFDIPGSPSSTSIAVSINGTISCSWLDWCGPNTEFCRIVNGYGKDQWEQYEIKNCDRMGTKDNPPSTATAIDDQGRIVSCGFDWNDQEQGTWIRTYTPDKGWSGIVSKGSDGQIAVTWSLKDKLFYLVYVKDGGIVLERFSLDPGMATPTPTVTPTPDPVNYWEVVTQYEVYEKQYQTSPGWGNPFKDVIVYGEFCRKGVCQTVTGFYAGDNVFILRFRPDITGDWTYRTWSEPSNETFNKHGQLRVISSTAKHGPLSRRGKFLIYDDGSYYQSRAGGTAFGLLSGGPYRQFLADMLAKGVRYFRIGLNITWGRGQNQGQFSGCGDDGYVNGCWLNTFAWGFTPFPADTSRDWTQMNLGLMAKLDDVLRYLYENGATAEIVLFDSSAKYILGPNETAWQQGTLYTVDDPRQYELLSYLSRRYSAYPNFWWEIGNEIRHNDSRPYQQFWPQSKNWVRWVGQTIKQLSPDHIVAYDAQWTENEWSYNPTSMALNPAYPTDATHASLWGEDWCDIINIHSDRSPGEWWWKTAEQVFWLTNAYDKPVSADEPHRKGYFNLPCTDDEIRKALWLTTMTGTGLYTLHGVSNGDICRGCIESGDIPGAKIFSDFFGRLGTGEFYPDYSLIVSNGDHLRAMHRDANYVYYGEGISGQVTLKTFQEASYELYAIDASNGNIFSDKTIMTKDASLVLPGSISQFAAYLKPYIEPTPTATATAMPTATASPTPTKKPGGGGYIGCGKMAVASDGGEQEPAGIDSFLLSVMAGVLLFLAFLSLRKGNGVKK